VGKRRLSAIAALSLALPVATASLTPASASTPTANAGATLDQSSDFAPPYAYSSAVGQGSGYAQTFTAGITGSLTKVALGIAMPNNSARVPAYLTVGIYQSVSGVPTGSALASTTITDFSGMPTESEISASSSRRTFDVHFTTPTAVTAGSTYAIAADAASNGDNFSWYLGSAYGGGSGAYRSNGPWTADPGFVVVFSTYVLTPTSSSEPVSHPTPILQQFGKPLEGTCEEAAPVSLNWGGAQGGGWGESWEQWMNDGKGGSVCTRTLAFSRALDKWTVG
jgi:hypothetical protein